MVSIADLDDAVIRMRAAGMSYGEMAEALGLRWPSSAQLRYRSARARQIPPELQPRRLPVPSPAFVAWAAGFLDGEGCVYGYENRGPRTHGRFQFGVLIGQAMREPLDDLAAAWGGTVHSITPTVAHYKDQWRWQIGGRDAAVFLEDVLPHLRVKYEAAVTTIPCLRRVHADRAHFTEQEIADRRVAVAILRRLNRRGKGVI